MTNIIVTADTGSGSIDQYKVSKSMEILNNNNIHVSLHLYTVVIIVFVVGNNRSAGSTGYLCPILAFSCHSILPYLGGSDPLPQYLRLGLGERHDK